MKKSMALTSVLLVAAGLSSAAMAADKSPYAYTYAVYGGSLVSGASLEKVNVETPDTSVSLPEGGLPSKLGRGGDKNQGLIVIYSTHKSEKSVKADLTYLVNTGGAGPQTCKVSVSSPNIYDKAQQLQATLVTGSCEALFHPAYGTNPKDGDQAVTVNWKVE